MMITTLQRVLLIMIVCAVAVPALAMPDSGPALDFNLPKHPKGELSLSKQRGNVVMLNFWASWCAPCREEFPLMDDLLKRYEALGFTIVAVNIDQRRELADKMLAQLNPSFTVVFDTENKVSQRYQLEAMPSTFFLDRKGNIRFAHKGYRAGDESKYEDFIRTLIKE